MTADTLASVVSVFLSLAFAYVPGVKTWYDAREGTQKAGIMALLLIVVAAASFAASCGQILALGISCDKSGAVGLAQILIAALVANQTSYMLLVKPFQNSQVSPTIIRLLILLFILAGSYFFIAPQPVSAESPQPYLYVMTRCSGLSITQLQSTQQDFDSAYGWAHQLTTSVQWSASYEARANEFAHALGCPQPLRDGALTFAYKIYVPTYQYIWTLFPD